MKTSYDSPLVLDGGFSNQLETLGCNLDHPLWTAEALRTHPEKIVRVHHDYLQSGANIITTSSYQATITGLEKIGMSAQDAEALILKSVDLAAIARDAYLDENPEALLPRIAASIGPFGAYLADGSEYKGDYNITIEGLRKFHERKIRLLDSSAADWLACETIPSYKETEVLVDILDSCIKPSWITFSCKNGTCINDGTPISEAVALTSDTEGIFAVGVNCTKPIYISQLIKEIKAAGTRKKIIVYPNSGENYDASSKSWTGTQGFSSDMIREWLNLGVDIIGGCCRIGPAEINRISKVI